MEIKPKVAVLFGFGINCDRETAAVFDLAGAESERVHVNNFVNGKGVSVMPLPMSVEGSTYLVTNW